MGGGGEEFGLSCTRGPQAFRHMATMNSRDVNSGDRDTMDFLGFTIDPLYMVPPELRGPLEKAKFPARRDTLVPYFAVKEPCCRLRTINQREAELMLYALNAILRTLAAGTFKPGLFLPGHDLLTLSVNGDLSEPEVAVGQEHFAIPDIGGDDDGDELKEPDDPNYVPASNDLDGWKEVDLRVTDRLARLVMHMKLVNANTMKEYYGQTHEGVPPELARGSYIDWLSCSYRPAPNSLTLAEQLLQCTLPQPDRLLLESRAKSIPTLCRTQSVKGECAVQMEDIFSGDRFAAYDRLLAEGVRRLSGLEVILPVRYYRAGSFTFIAGAGPNFTATQLPQALEFLAQQGLQPTKRGFEQNAHLLGRLFRWEEEAAQNRKMPSLCNTDREPLEWQTASYEVQDEKALRRSLKNSRNIEQEGDDHTHYAWFRKEKKSGLGERTLLGRIELVGGEMVTEVNSSARQEKLRQMLEAIPGVRLLGLTRKTMAQMMDGQPLDDELNPAEPLPMTPELAAALSEKMRDYYMDWLDQPLPALTGKTPRQASRTKSGKLQVATLIRGIPAPMMGDGAAMVEVPREEMLRELGLE